MFAVIEVVAAYPAYPGTGLSQAHPEFIVLQIFQTLIYTSRLRPVAAPKSRTIMNRIPL
jgi:hypothetical protein